MKDSNVSVVPSNLSETILSLAHSKTHNMQGVEAKRSVKPDKNSHQMLNFANIGALILVTKVVECTSYNQCNGNKQNLSFPKGYDKDVPDAFETGNATEVRIKYGLKQLRKVIEKR